MDTTTYYYNSEPYSTATSSLYGAFFMFMLVMLLIIMLIVVVPSIVGLWKLFAKAGKPGWAAIVPVYNIVVWCQIVGRPIWWILLFFVPVANIFVNLALCIDLAKSFGKDLTFGILTWLFAPVMLLIMAFSKDTRYVGPIAEGTDMFSSFSHQTVPVVPQQAVANPFTPEVPAPAAPEAPVAAAPFTAPVQPEAPISSDPSTGSDQNKIV